MILKTNSWHYRLASKYAHMDERPHDFCSYARKVLQGGILALMLALVGAAVLFFYVYLGAQLVAAYVSGVWMLEWYSDAVWGAVWETVTLGSIAAYIGYQIWDQNTYQARLEKKRAALKANGGVARQPGFFTMLYRTIREKTCFTVTYK